MSKSIEVRVQGGYISARTIDDPECPGIKTVFIPDDGNDNYSASYPSIKMEKLEDSPLHALIWNDSENALHSDEIIFKEPEPKKDIFTERMEKIRTRAKREKERKGSCITERIEQTKALKDRIQTLLKLATECFKVGVEIDLNCNLEIGLLKLSESKEFEYLVLCGKYSDFYTNGDELFVKDRYTGQKFDIKACSHGFNYIEKFLAQFDAFETAFYEWVDSLDDDVETSSSNKNDQSSKCKYETFDELNEAWFGKTGKSRLDLTDREEYAYIHDCFDLYEKIGFAKTFNSLYALSPNYKYSGMRFEVLGRAYEPDNKMPMWDIELENGDVIMAYPSEICLAEMDQAD